MTQPEFAAFVESESKRSGTSARERVSWRIRPLPGLDSRRPDGPFLEDTVDDAARTPTQRPACLLHGVKEVATSVSTSDYPAVLVA